MCGCESWTINKAEPRRIDTFELWYWRRLLRVPWTARRSNQSILKEIVLNIHWKNWCWGWNSNTLTTWCEELTYWKRPWCWERLKAGGKGDDRGWDGWMASLTQWIWIWASSGSWWWTGKPGVLQSMGSQNVGHDWATKLNWSGINLLRPTYLFFPDGSDSKESTCNVGDMCLIPGLGWFPGREWLPSPVFDLENSMDRGAWQATVHGVTKTWLSNFHFACT